MRRPLLAGGAGGALHAGALPRGLLRAARARLGARHARRGAALPRARHRPAQLRTGPPHPLHLHRPSALPTPPRPARPLRPLRPPVIDLLHFGQVGIRASYDDKRQGFAGKTVQPIKAGQELLFYYGNFCIDDAINMCGIAPLLYFPVTAPCIPSLPLTSCYMPLLPSPPLTSPPHTLTGTASRLRARRCARRRAPPRSKPADSPRASHGPRGRALLRALPAVNRLLQAPRGATAGLRGDHRRAAPSGFRRRRPGRMRPLRKTAAPRVGGPVCRRRFTLAVCAAGFASRHTHARLARVRSAREALY